MRDDKQMETRLLFNIPPVNEKPSSTEVEKSDTHIIIDPSPTTEELKQQLKKLGSKFENLPKEPPNTPPKSSFSSEIEHSLPKGNIYHTALVFLFIFGVSILFNLSKGWDIGNFFIDSVGIYLLLYSFLSLIDIKTFSNSLQAFDPIAKHCPIHGKLLSFILIIIASSLLSRSITTIALLLTITLFTIQSFGILKVIINKKQYRSSSLGSLLPVRVSENDLIENSIVVLLAASAILVL